MYSYFPSMMESKNLDGEELENIINQNNLNQNEQKTLNDFSKEMVRQMDNLTMDDLEISRCENYATNLKIYYVIGILFIYLLLLVRCVSWIVLITIAYRIFRHNVEEIPIDIDAQPEQICVQYNHDCAASNNPCSKWLYRWHASFMVKDKQEEIIINTETSKEPKYIFKKGSIYHYPCSTKKGLISKFFGVLLIVIVLEVIYGGYLFKSNCSMKYKHIGKIPSPIMLFLFIFMYCAIMKYFGTISKASFNIKEDFFDFIRFLYF